MASQMPGETAYDINQGMWVYEPHYTQDAMTASPCHGQDAKPFTLRLDTQAVDAYPQSLQEPFEPWNLQASPVDVYSATVSPQTLKRQGSDLLSIANSDVPSRSNSKRSKQGKNDVPSRGNSKRERFERREDDLYQCTWPGCEQKYKLMCEARKHFKAKHSPDLARPHGCPHCEKRFNWPKDVRRHIRQVHKDVDQVQELGIRSAEEPPDSGLAATRERRFSFDFEQNFEDEYTLSPDDDYRHPPSPMSPLPGVGPPAMTKKKKKLSLSSVSGLIMALHSLSAHFKERSFKHHDDADEDSRYVLVTQDQSVWHKVYLDGVQTSANLMHKIRDVCQNSDGRAFGKLLLYRYQRNKPNRRLDEDKLLQAVREATTAHRTLELVLSPVISASTHYSRPLAVPVQGANAVKPFSFDQGQFQHVSPHLLQES